MTDKSPPNPLDLTEEEYLAILAISEHYHAEAKRCRTGKAYLAGVAMVGAALEAALICMVACDAAKIATWADAPKHRGQLKPLLRWSMSDLMHAGEFAGWLPRGLQPSEGWDANRALPGDYVELLRLFRNLVHPARYRQDFMHERMSKKLLNRLLNILDGAIFPQFEKIASSRPIMIS